MKEAQKFIDPMKDLYPDILDVQKPARYVGGEVGSHPPSRSDDIDLRIALCFPDLYEIGMSNNAIRILYNALGAMSPKILCERVFAPAPDFEALLRKRSVPLFTLESGAPLNSCDLLCFSIGYELLATNILTVLDLGNIPLLSRERSDEDPIVIAGGPAITNPLPLGRFLDAVYIGEAEAGFYDLVSKIASMKREKARRGEILDFLRASPHIWTSDAASKTPKKAKRAIFEGFPAAVEATAYPIPVIPTVQSHGTVEIMRGCPNGCRFCHAGYFYRPQRVKSYKAILSEVSDLVTKGGYREITLASLSSGDYPDIQALLKKLNSEFSRYHVSFQLPSLKVDSFTLPLLASVSELRKSGLTFAVETPIESWQARINKSVSLEKVSQILSEAKKLGFRLAKFYFMIGLPVPERGRGEAEAIVAFLKQIARVERMELHVNVGTFVPKPHTPFQRERQLSEAEAWEAIDIIKRGVRCERNIKISYHSPFVSLLEGVLSRGDELVGESILEAYRAGARLDAWDEHMREDIWRRSFENLKEASAVDLQTECLNDIPLSKKLPWDSVNILVSGAYLRREMGHSERELYTSICTNNCTHKCGACTEKHTLVTTTELVEVPKNEGARAAFANEPGEHVANDEESATSRDFRLIFNFEKGGCAVLYPLHSLSNMFSRIFAIAGIPVRFSNGFNPIPKMEFLPPLALGVSSKSEILSTWITRQEWWKNSWEFKENLISVCNENLPSGIRVVDIHLGRPRSAGKFSLGSMYRASRYRIEGDETDIDSLNRYLLANTPATVREITTAEKEISFVVEDYKGGEASLSSLLKKAFAADKIFSRNLAVTREECYGLGEGASGERPLTAMLLS